MIPDAPGFSRRQGGLGVSIFARPGIFVTILAGIETDRYWQKRVTVLFLALLIAVAMISLSRASCIRIQAQGLNGRRWFLVPQEPYALTAQEALR